MTVDSSALQGLLVSAEAKMGNLVSIRNESYVVATCQYQLSEDVDLVNVEVINEYGPKWEQSAAGGIQLFTFVFSLLNMAYYAYCYQKASVGWEEAYVCFIESESWSFGSL